MKLSQKRVLILATGGTISGKSDTRSAIGYNVGAVTGQDLIAGVPGLGKLAQLQVEQIANIASQNVNSQIWFRLADRIHRAFAQNETDAVVIIHGTDTMEETAFFLSHVINSQKPVILTGSMRPGTAISADGPANLYQAVLVASDKSAQGRGVMVVLNDTIHSARLVTKTSTTSLQTFQSRNGSPLGVVDSATVRFFGPSSPVTFLPLPDNQTLPVVRIVYAHADMDASQIDEAVKAKASGIIVAGMGNGNISQSALDALDRAVKAGLVVVRSSRVGDGFVNRNVEINDDEHDFVASGDLNPQKSRILLQLILAGSVTNTLRIQKIFSSGF